MLKIEFEYRDAYTDGEWNTQTCIVHSVEECKKLYGLGVDCEYAIVRVEDLDE